MVCTSVLPAPSIASCRRLRTSWPVLRPPVRAPLGSVAGTCSRPWMRATSSTRSISRVTSSARHVGGRARKPSDGEAESLEDRPALRGADVDARHRQHTPGAQRDPRRLGQVAVHVDRLGCERRARDLDEQPRRRAVRDRGERRIDALLEPVRRLRAQPDAPGRAQHRAAVERRRLEHDVAGRRPRSRRRPRPSRPRRPTGRRRARSRASRDRARAPCRRAWSATRPRGHVARRACARGCARGRRRASADRGRARRSS